MADKQLSSPVGLLPSWANDLNINDPGEAWDATPTKVDPGVGKRNTGFLPEENPAAQEWNFERNLIARWLQYFSAMQVLNWQDVGAPVDASTAQTQTAEALTYDEGATRWHVAGQIQTVGGEVTVSGDGFTWQEIAQPVAQPWSYAASKPPDAQPLHTGPNTVLSDSTPSAALQVVEFLTASTTAFAITGTGTSGVNQHVWDPGNQRWIFVGGSNLSVTPVPAIWTRATPMGGPPNSRTATPSLSTVAELVAANGSGLSVVVGDAAPFDVWTSTDATTYTRATPIGITAGQSAKALAWDRARAVFVLVTDRETYTSVDGVTWILLSTLAGTADPFQIRCLASDGGRIYVAAGDCAISGLTHIRYSLDGGVEWRLVVVPPSEDPGGGGSTNPITSIAYSRFARRFMIGWLQGGASNGNMALSLAVGSSELSPDFVISTPTV